MLGEALFSNTISIARRVFICQYWMTSKDGKVQTSRGLFYLARDTEWPHPYPVETID